MPRITPNLWFDGRALDAAEYYVSVFPNSRITDVSRMGDRGPVITASFELDGQRFLALNGGPEFRFTEAVSFVIDCADQAEVDRYWDELTSDGGEEGRCGWLTDRFGLSWQVVPRALVELLTDPDPRRATAAGIALQGMSRIDVSALHAAARAVEAGVGPEAPRAT
ncbi:VOC family protein [Leucobacter sp. wl10]|uniref:VOC family protein n=1 Tax=Leucobacter sp. wl10 TaxID=2304677 RepID=UPI000E5A442F|nr:VOC family protein [Leucobacter sp. wl10]RGE21433.1 VOC family protein [Leucobacter sp. wl10]